MTEIFKPSDNFDDSKIQGMIKFVKLRTNAQNDDVIKNFIDIGIKVAGEICLGREEGLAIQFAIVQVLGTMGNSGSTVKNKLSHDELNTINMQYQQEHHLLSQMIEVYSRKIY